MPGRGLGLGEQHERRRRRRPSRRAASAACLVDGRVEAGGVEHGQRLALGVHRQRAAQRGPAGLAVDLDGVVARLRARTRCRRRSRPASATSRRGRGRCPSGATAWRRRRETSPRVLVDAVPWRRALSSARTVSCTSGMLKRGLEGRRVERRAAAAELGSGPSHRCAPPRSRPCGPGTAPRTSIRLRSGMISTTVRPRWVTRPPPIRPGPRMPLNTREGVAEAPIEPGRAHVVRAVATWGREAKLWRLIVPWKPLPLDLPEILTFWPTSKASTVTVSPTSSSPASSRNSTTWRWAEASAFLRWPSSALVSAFSLQAPKASCTAS